MCQKKSFKEQLCKKCKYEHTMNVIPKHVIINQSLNYIKSKSM